MTQIGDPLDSNENYTLCEKGSDPKTSRTCDSQGGLVDVVNWKV